MGLNSITLVGGTFDSYGGKPSSIITKMATVLKLNISNLTVVNGGSLDELKSLVIRKR